MTFPRRIPQRFTACIAILAVLLLFVAPVVSKTLVERHEMTNPSLLHSMTDMDGMAHHAMMDMDMPGTMAMDGAACGYCDLLIHVPLMIWVFAPLIWLMMCISRAPPAPRREQPPRQRIERIQHPRAPPTSFRFEQ